MARKRSEHIIHEDEIEIGPFQLQLMFGPSWKEDIEIAVNSIFCDCGAQTKKLVEYKSYLNDLNDVILKGLCNSCNTIAARYIETGERRGIEKIANKIRRLNKE
ncbi:hypothetical protein HPE56_08650 [Maribacter sp. ANRC-HE7]|uniref:Uncharacterized protein n=1 Tax=Maribacter aquimaris TaxID=2737171 RepID=A0ABR7V3H4_9FLAO|nr:hypothetical protein [Maribacter aquimaris]MBD0777861.1 hypothetical protein [Maribacter aquimaris]